MGRGLGQYLRMKAESDMKTSSPSKMQKPPGQAPAVTAQTKSSAGVKTVPRSLMGQRVTPAMIKGALDF